MSTQQLQGDINGLVEALKTLGVTQDEIASLKNSIKHDPGMVSGISPETSEWLKLIGPELRGAGIGKTIATKWVMQYLGLDDASSR